MRRYQHKPDTAGIERRYTRRERGVATVTETVEHQGTGGGGLSIFDVATPTVVETARLRWAPGEPLDLVRSRIVQASARAGEAGERRRVLDGGTAERWLAEPWLAVVVAAAADWSVTAELVRRVPDPVGGWAQLDPATRRYLLTLSRLTRWHPHGAASAAGAMALAAATPDQEGFDRAGRKRTEAVVQRRGRSVEGGRDAEALLGIRAAALAALGRRAGLRLFPDDPSLGTEILVAAA